MNNQNSKNTNKYLSKVIVIFFILVILFSSISKVSAYFVGSSNSNIYHYPGCYWAQQISYYNLITFNSPSEAISRGYRGCYVCYPPSRDYNITKLRIDTPKTLKIGESSDIYYTYWPAGAIDTNLSFSSSDTSVAPIINGTIYGKKVGTTEITATTPNNVTYTYTLHVTPILAESISITNPFTELGINEIISLNAEILPSNTTDKSIVWKSSNNNIAVVSEDGNVKGISSGKATITATCGNKSNSIKINVKKIDVAEINLESIKSNIYINETYNIKPLIKPFNASNKHITYTSSDNSIISIDENGNAIAKREGSCKIVFECDGIKKEKEFTSYYLPITKIQIFPINILSQNETVPLNFEVIPQKNSNTNLIYDITNPNLLAIEENNLITKKCGITKLTIIGDERAATQIIFITNTYINILLPILLILLVVIIKHIYSKKNQNFK